MLASVLTVGDLFMENDDWVNDEEAQVFQRIEDLIREFKKDNPLKRPMVLDLVNCRINNNVNFFIKKA